ncbi:MAG: glycosyltransferase family 39 protein [Candidatus Moraniibacteriota bacterium]
MKTLLISLSERKWGILIFCCILVVGIFLRTYEFHDFLRFNADQSRDAGVVSSYIEGEAPLPLLGPKAGGTDFRVGPVFYYFQIASAKLFGNVPTVMAYPDLLFSILAIPLLFFFLRKYFDTRTALLLVAIFAVSAYAVKYSRFAWNPNSLPFWSILFLSGLHEMMIAKGRRYWQWVILTGTAFGVGIQLHTLSLLFFPILLSGVFAFLFFETKAVGAADGVSMRTQWKALCMIIIIAAFLNFGQIVSEVRSGGENTASFFGGVGTKQEKGSGIIHNALKDVVCYTEANIYILSSYDTDDGCGLGSVVKARNIPLFGIGFLFSALGLILAWHAFRREEDTSKKYFLGIVFSYLVLSFLILLPLANEVSMRFFLAMIFMPFLLLGLWFDFLRERMSKYSGHLVAVLVCILVVMNLSALRQSFAISKSYLTNSRAGMDNIMLKEVETASAFIVAHADGAMVVAVDGDAKFLFKGLKSMNYFTSRSSIKLVEKNKKADPNIPVFLIENTRQKDAILEHPGGVDDFLSFGRFTIFSFKR